MFKECEDTICYTGMVYLLSHSFIQFCYCSKRFNILVGKMVTSSFSRPVVQEYDVEMSILNGRHPVRSDIRVYSQHQKKG
jgi:hypothetical protein